MVIPASEVSKNLKISITKGKGKKTKSKRDRKCKKLEKTHTGKA